MSHDNFNKRGRSLYLENWNPNAKKYINECRICGHRGYSPAIEEPEFLEGPVINTPIYRELTRTMKKLELDSEGRCPVCAAIQDGRS